MSDNMGVLQAYGTGEHVVLRWWNRTYHGHITDVDSEGFRLSNAEDGGVWSGWDEEFSVEEPWWEVPTTSCAVCLTNAMVEMSSMMQDAMVAHGR